MPTATFPARAEKDSGWKREKGLGRCDGWFAEKAQMIRGSMTLSHAVVVVRLGK